MALQIKSLKQDRLPTTETELALSGSKSRIIRNIRLTNVGSVAATINLKIDRGGTGTRYLLTPKDIPLPAGYTLIADEEISMGPTDKLYGSAGSGSPKVDYIINGVEKDS